MAANYICIKIKVKFFFGRRGVWCVDETCYIGSTSKAVRKGKFNMLHLDGKWINLIGKIIRNCS